MNPNREEALFAAALEQLPFERAAFLKGACLGDHALRQRVEALLAAHEATDGILAGDSVREELLPTMKQADPVTDEAVGQTLGRYKLLEKVGEGGCGVVYVAEQTEPVRRRVALKVIKLGMDTKQVVARFEAERQALAMMDHPNIAKVLDAGTTEQGRPFFVMELVRGIKITDYCDQANSSTRDRLDLFIKVCQAIQHAHQKGIVHRDIKPSNILVTLHDGVPVPKVIDFGIAKATEGRLTDNTVYTQLHQFIGTPAYMSPEQAEMSGLDIDTRSDIYSLGVLLYELLAGSTPFDAKELMASGLDAMRKTIREKEPVRPSTRLATLGADQLTTTAKCRSVDTAKLVHQLQGDLDWIVMKCLEKDRQRRYETANGLAADIKRHLDNEPVAARPPSTTYKFQKAFRRNKLVFAAAGAVAAALLLGVVVSAWQAVRATRASRAESSQRLIAEGAQAVAQAKQREAEAERTRAETEQRRADAQARKAVQNQEHSRRLLYAADMNLAQQAFNQNNLGRARRLLDRHRPMPGEEDLRGWEWRYLWQQCRSTALPRLTQRSARGFSVSFSPDGAQLAVGFVDGWIELWDVQRRIRLKELNQTGPPAHVAFSPRTNLLAASGEQGILKLYDLARGRDTVVELPVGFPAIRELTFSPDGSRLLVLAFGWGGSQVVVVDTVAGATLASLSTNTNLLPGVHSGTARLSSDSKRLYLSHAEGRGSQPRKVRCLDAVSRAEIWSTRIATDYGVTAMALSPDDQFLVTGTGYEDSTIRVWSAANGKLVTELKGHTSWLGELTFSRDGRWLASAAADQTIRLWETTGWTEARVLRGHGDEVHAVAFSPDGRMLASAAKDGEILLWDVTPPNSAYGYRPFSSDVHALAEYAPGLAIALGADSRGPRGFRVRLEDLSEVPVLTGADLSTPFTYLPPNAFAHYDQTNTLRLTEYGETGTVLFRDSVGPDLVRHYEANQAVLAYSREHHLMAWGTTSGVVHIAGLDRTALRWQWTSELYRPTPLAFSPDGKLLVLTGQYPSPVRGPDGKWLPPILDMRHGMELREVATGKVILRSKIRLDVPEYRPTVVFADAGRKMVSLIPGDRSDVGLAVLFWDLTRPQELPKRFTARGGPTGICVSPDGRWVVVGSEAGLAIAYDAVAMEPSRVFQGNAQAVFSVAFSPDSRTVASGVGAREAIKLWQVETGQELLTLPGKGMLLEDIAFAEDGNTLLLGRFRQPGSWQMWRAPSWAVINDTEAKDPPPSNSGGPGNAAGRQP